jgi:hypothetical protein
VGAQQRHDAAFAQCDGGAQHLWLAADSMDAGEWRDLRRLVLQKPTQE